MNISAEENSRWSCCEFDSIINVDLSLKYEFNQEFCDL